MLFLSPGWLTFRSLHGKPYFLFPDLLKRWSFQNNCAGIWYFLYHWERSCFFFPKTWSYTLDEKWKMVSFSKKINGNMIFPSGLLKRWSFQKGPRRDMIFLVLSGKMVSFSRIHDTFSLGRKPEIIFLKKYMEIWYFLWIRTGVRKVVSGPSVKKKSKMVLSRKNKPTSDWRSRLTS